jgi:hypothetical protein
MSFSDSSTSNTPKYGAIPSIPDVGNIDINKLYKKPSQSSGPDYLPINNHGRDFYGRLTFNTGVLWLLGFTSGGLYGTVEGWRSAPNPAFKVRFNSVLNGIARRGSNLGSSLGVIGKTFFASYHVIFELTNDQSCL